MHFSYKEESFLAYIILRDFVKNQTLESGFFFEFCMGYGAMTPCSVMNLEPKNND